MRGQKKILLLAYTNLNFGDDMFVYTISRIFPEQEFVLYAPDSYREVYKNVHSLKVIRKPVYKRIYTELMRKIPILKTNVNVIGYDAIVYVIGGLFDEDEIWERNVEKYGLPRVKNEMLRYSYDKKTPFFLLGCNLTRVKTQKYIDEMKFLFNGLTDVCVRDRYSYEFFKSMNNVRCAPDIVLNYNCSTTKEKNGVLISVWGPLTCVDKFPQWKWAENLWDAYEKFIIDITKKFIEMGEHVTYLALCKNEGDLEACYKVNSDGGLSTDIVVYNGNIDEVINLFEKASFVVGTRFHSVVMAMNAKCAIYPIVYESKTKQLLIDSGYNGTYSDIEDEGSYSVNAVIENYLERRRIPCEELKQRASMQFDKLKLFVKG